MNKELFEQKYKNLGGLPKLQEMMKNLETLDGIGKYFGVSKERVRQWSFEMFGEKYGAQKDRRAKRLVEVIAILKKDGVAAARKAARYRSLFEEAILKAGKQ